MITLRPEISAEDWHNGLDANLVDVEALGTASNGHRVTAVSGTLFGALAYYTNPGDLEALSVLLQFVVQVATDTATQEWEPKGELYASQPFAALEDRPVWLQPNGRGLTAMFPGDY